MKSLNQYIIDIEESLVFENANGEIILEGFWKKLGSLFGYNTAKVAKTMANWSDDLKKGFTTGQYIAAKSKDENIRKAAKEEAQAAEKGSKELLKTVKLEVHRLMKIIKDLSIPDYSLNQWDKLKNLSEQENDNEGIELAKKFKEIIDKKWPDGEKEYEKISSKIEKAGVDDGPKSNENSENTDTGNTKVSKEVTNETTDTIKENTDLLTPLAKKANVDGKVLRNFVSAKLRKTLGKIGEKGTREAVQKALTEDVILGTCIMVLGALITNDEAKIKAISEQIGSNADELNSKLQKYEKQYK